MIPKVLNFTWFWPLECPKHLLQTWIDKNPDFEIKLWTEENIWELINQKQFDSINEYCWKSDIARYEILYKYGWIYCDIDSVCFEPLWDNFTNYHWFCCWESEKARPYLIANWYIWFEKWNKIMKDMIEFIWNISVEEINKERAWRTTWPILFSKVVKDNLDKISILPSYLFMPTHISWETYTWDGKIYWTQYWATGLNRYWKI